MHRPDINFLINIFAAKKVKNPHYSLRAFARDCGVSITSLSQYLNEKRLLSKKNLENIYARLKIDPLEIQKWVLFQEQYRKQLGLSNTRLKLPSYKFLNSVKLEIIGNWQSLGILALLQDKKVWNIQKIQRESSLPKKELLKILKNLQMIGMIEQHQDSGCWSLRDSSNLASSSDIPSKVIQSYHKSILKLSIKKIEEVKLEHRDYGSTIMLIDTRKIPKAKEKIRNFRRKLCAFLEEGEPNEVYIFNQQLFPLFSNKKNRKKK